MTFLVFASDGTAPPVSTSVTVLVLPDPDANQPPEADTPSTTSQDWLTGAVTGAFNFVDPNEDSLTYLVHTQPNKGALELDDVTGVYTYTPTVAARLAAAQTVGTDTDSFTVAVSDGTLTTTTTVTVTVLPVNLGSAIASTSTGAGPTGLR